MAEIKNLSSRAILFTTFLYVSFVSIFSYFHEVWRDEVVVVNIVRDSNSLLDLFSNLHNYGHPALWQSLVYIAYNLLGEYYVIKLLAILISTLGVIIFLKFSSFDWRVKLLFIFGFFPFYLFPVFARNYGLIMFLSFCFCALYNNRWKNFIPMAVVLFLLANTHVHALILVFAILLSFAYEIFYEKKVNIRFQHILGFFIITAGVGFSIWQLFPDKTSTYFHKIDFSAYKVFRSVVASAILPGRIYKEALGFNSAVFVTGVVWCIYLYLIRKPKLFLLYASAVFGLGLFVKFFYPIMGMRHESVFYLLIIIVFWLDNNPSVQLKTNIVWLNSIWKIMERYKVYFLCLIFTLQITAAFSYIKEDITRDYSASKNFGALINNHDEYRNAIIMAESDTFIESLPYYIDNKIYMHREHKFGRYVSFTTYRMLDFNLEELLLTGQWLKEKYNCPVLILLEYDIDNVQTPFIKKKYSGSQFTFTDHMVKRFKMETQKIASLRDAISSEKYDVYLIK